MHLHRIFTGCVVFASIALFSGCTQTPDVVFHSPSSQSPSSAKTVATSAPRSVLIEVPFSPQAPSGNWDDPYQEACEEMSLIMVHHFLKGTPLSREQADKELLELVAWETQHGYSQDVTIAELEKIAEEYYGHTARVIDDVSTDSLKALLVQGHPVIVPAAGRDLGNPYFSGEGPWYHMLVLTGFTNTQFITNDPGTKRGEGYTYGFNVLLDAVHDWTGVKEEIGGGARRVLIVE